MITSLCPPPSIYLLRNEGYDPEKLCRLINTEKLRSKLDVSENYDNFEAKLRQANDNVALIITHCKDCTAKLLESVQACCPEASIFAIGHDLQAKDLTNSQSDHVVHLEHLDEALELADHALALANMRRELKLAHEELKRHECLEALVPDAVVAENAGHCIVSWNKAAEMLFGWTAEQTIGKKRSEFLHTNDAQTEVTMETALAHAGSCAGEVFYATQNGREVQVFSRRQRTLDERGAINGWIEVCTPSASLRVSEEKTRLLERLEAMLAEVPPGKAEQLDQVLATFARMALPTLGETCIIDILGDDDLLRRVAFESNNLFLDALSPEQKLDFPIYSGAHFTCGEVLKTGKVLVVDRVLKLHEFLGFSSAQSARMQDAPAMAAMVTPVTAFGKPTGLITLLGTLPHGQFRDSDVAAVRQFASLLGSALEKSLLGRKLEIESMRSKSASGYKENFLGALSHELRTPLQTMLGWTHMLRDSSFSKPKAAKILNALERSINTQGQTISHLLELARVNSGTLELQTKPCSVRPILESVIAMQNVSIQAKHLRFEFIPEAEAYTLADVKWLQRAFWNVIGNAVKFTAGGGWVSVRLSADETHARVTIEDSGIGISREFLPFVFDYFSQQDAGTMRGHGGLGIGLAVARHIVEAHGGRIEAESEGLQKGARFSIYLPLCTPPNPLHNSQKHPSRRLKKIPLLQSLRVLLVEDDSDTREMLRFLLEHAGASVAAAASAQFAYQLLKQGTFDVLISDVGLPDDDGKNLMRKVRELDASENGNIPAIALTAYGKDEVKADCLEAGFNLHITKPVDPSRLLEMVKQASKREFPANAALNSIP